MAALALLLLAACSSPTVYRDRPVNVRVPVPQPCAGERPAKVAPLKDTTPDWVKLDVKQKAARVSKQALELRGYGEQLDAATRACP